MKQHGQDMLIISTERPFMDKKKSLNEQEEPNAVMNEKDVSRNLKDAGCCYSMICEYLGLCKAGSKEKKLQLLENYRRELIECLHEAQKKIDCLDYLIYKIRNDKDEK